MKKEILVAILVITAIFIVGCTSEAQQSPRKAATSIQTFTIGDVLERIQNAEVIIDYAPNCTYACNPNVCVDAFMFNETRIVEHDNGRKNVLEPLGCGDTAFYDNGDVMNRPMMCECAQT